MAIDKCGHTWYNIYPLEWEVLCLWPNSKIFLKGMKIMCRVKEGTAVVSRSDLQNLVTSVVFRQMKPFSVNDVARITRQRLEGSIYLTEPLSPEVEVRCRETVKTLFLANRLKATTTPGFFELSSHFPLTTWAFSQNAGIILLLYFSMCFMLFVYGNNEERRAMTMLSLR